MDISKTAVVDGKEFEIPEGFTPLGEDGLFLADFDLLELAEEPDLLEVGKEGDIQFFNPRHLGKCDEAKGQGFGKDEMHELMNDIQRNGLEYHLCGFWTEKDGKVKAKVNDGERRWRCVDRMRAKDEKAWSPKDQQFMSARDIYAKVPIKIKPMSQEEALMRACAVSETAVKWGDAAMARLIQALYAKGKNDDTVCKLVNKGPQWVSETYSLNNLDSVCFNYLLTNKINRTVAKQLLKITDEAERQRICVDAFKDAVVNHEATVDVAEKAVEKAEDKEELARAELEEAKLNGADTETIAALEQKIVEAGEKTKVKKQNKAASARPMAKSKNLRAATGGSKSMTAAKIGKQLDSIKELIDKNDETYAPVATLKVAEIILKALLQGDDIKEALKSA